MELKLRSLQDQIDLLRTELVLLRTELGLKMGLLEEKLARLLARGAGEQKTESGTTPTCGSTGGELSPRSGEE